MTRCLLVVVTATLGALASVRSDACCNSFSGGRSTVMQFHGARGTLASPFLIPGELLRITRRLCDGPPNTLFPANAPDDVRTVVVVRPQKNGEKMRAIVLKHGTNNGPCNDGDAFTASCDAELAQAAPGGTAECFTVANYNVQPSVVDIEIPDLLPLNLPRATSAPAAVAVLLKTDRATVCGQLAKGNHCSQIIRPQDPPLACIDQIGVPTDPTSPCGGMVIHPVFREATLLPVTNDSKGLCHKSVGKPSCDPQPADELRYSVNQPGDVLIPMRWKRNLDECPGQSVRVHGEVRSPCRLQVPDNNSQEERNRWLESYTFDGRINSPPFARENPSNSALNRFEGTTDEPFSVLRFGVHYGACSSSSGELCNHPDQCSSLGDTCDSICTNSNGPCGPSQPCSSAAGQCGTLHEFRLAYAAGRWRVGRSPQTPPAVCDTSNDPHGFCEDDPTRLCNGNGECRARGDCASYLLTVGDCEPRDAGATVPPTLQEAAKDLPPVFRPLLQTLEIFRADKLVAAFSDDAVALIVPRMALGDKAVQCKSLGVDQVLVAASKARCQDGACDFTCPPLDAGVLVPRLAVYGTRVRFLQLPDVTTAAPGMFQRVVAFIQRMFRRLFGATEEQGAVPGAEAFLRILDTSTSTVTTIGEVVIDPKVDPLAILPSGATKMRAAAARCVADGGRTLGIPSLCNPNDGDECPAWATCQPADVIMVMDLSRVP